MKGFRLRFNINIYVVRVMIKREGNLQSMGTAVFFIKIEFCWNKLTKLLMQIFT